MNDDTGSGLAVRGFYLNNQLKESQVSLDAAVTFSFYGKMSRPVSVSVSKTFIGDTIVRIRGAGSRSVGPCCMQQRTVQFSDVL